MNDSTRSFLFPFPNPVISLWYPAITEILMLAILGHSITDPSFGLIALFPHSKGYNIRHILMLRSMHTQLVRGAYTIEL